LKAGRSWEGNIISTYLKELGHRTADSFIVDKIGSTGIDWFVKGGYLRRALALRNSIKCVTTNIRDMMSATFPVISIFKHIRKIAKSDSYVLSLHGKLGC